MELTENHACPACGGAGGGPMGRAGSAWDVDDYVCPRCEGRGEVSSGLESVARSRPGIAKAVALANETKKRALGKR